jgi:hypothetical protein
MTAPASTKRASSAHALKIVEGKDEVFIASYGGMFTARCSCGWTGEVRSKEEKARVEYDAHLAEA